MIKPDLICRDNVLMPGQLQFVHPETGALIATVNANTCAVLHNAIARTQKLTADA
jgi:hypothetical protein